MALLKNYGIQLRESFSTSGAKRTGFVKSRFMEEVTREEFEAILQEQDEVINDYNLNKTGLLKSRAKRYFSINVIGGGVKATLTILKYLRFLDMKELRSMKRRKQYHLYNRIVFGHLYGPYRQKLMYGLTIDVVDRIKAEYEI